MPQNQNQIYNKEFAGLSWFKPPVEKSYAKSANHNYCAQVDEKLRDEFVTYLAGKGIATSVHYFPNHLYDIYKPYARSLPVAERVWKKIVLLPLFPDLKESELAMIVEAVKKFRP
jgi:perosamine synthetase